MFCSVDDPARALAEVHRVLRPGGRFLFHEHVRGGPVRGVVQDLLTPLHRRLADGCHADRDFEALLASSPLNVESVAHLRMPTWIPTLVPLVVGAARRGDFDSQDPPMLCEAEQFCICDGDSPTNLRECRFPHRRKKGIAAMPAMDYEIHISGAVSDQVGKQLGDVQVTVQPAGTLLSGTVPDQAALHGLINRLHGAGLDLVEVRTQVPRQ